MNAFLFFNYDYDITIVVGIHRLSETVTVSRKVDGIYVDPSYSSVWSTLHDIAIVHLDQPLSLGNTPSKSQLTLME